jgi:hypothetical protein
MLGYTLLVEGCWRSLCTSEESVSVCNIFYEICVVEKVLQKVMCNISHISDVYCKTLV